LELSFQFRRSIMNLRELIVAASAALLSDCAAVDSRHTGFADYESDGRLGERVARVCFGSGLEGVGAVTPDTFLLEAAPEEVFLVCTGRCPAVDGAKLLQPMPASSCLSELDPVIPKRNVSHRFSHLRASADRSNDPNRRSSLLQHELRHRRYNDDRTVLPGCRIQEIYQWSHVDSSDTL
jgi:hypothetical protein